MKFKLNLTALESRENPSGTEAIPPVIPLIPILNEDGTPYVPPILGPALPKPIIPVPGIPLGPVGY